MPTPADAAQFDDEELLALLRDDSVTPEAITLEMEDAGAPPLAPPELSETRRLLAALKPEESGAIERLPPRLRGLVVEEAIAKQAAPLIGALAASNDKAVLKEAKRAIHLLRTKGVAVEVAKAAPIAAAPAAPAPEEFPAFMSAVDGFGERVLFYPCPVRNGVDVAQVVVSDETGVVSAHLAPLARKEYRKFVQSLPTTKGVLVGEVPRPYARGLIAAALDDNARARRPVPAGFNDVAFALGASVPPQTSPGRSLPAPEDVYVVAAGGRDLLALDELRSWLPSEAALQALSHKLEEIAASTLYVDDAQRGQAKQAAVEAAAQAFWTADRRRKFAERLFDLAWLLTQAGRLESAVLAQATALALDGDRPLESIPFAYALFERVAAQLEAKSKKP